MLDREQGLKKYPLGEFSNDKLLKTLEPQIIHWVTEVRTINPNEVAEKQWKENSKYHKRIGRDPTFFDIDEDIPYLAYDEKVNELHCKIFKKEEDSQFFLHHMMAEENI